MVKWHFRLTKMAFLGTSRAPILKRTNDSESAWKILTERLDYKEKIRKNRFMLIGQSLSSVARLRSCAERKQIWACSARQAESRGTSFVSVRLSYPEHFEN